MTIVTSMSSFVWCLVMACASAHPIVRIESQRGRQIQAGEGMQHLSTDLSSPPHVFRFWGHNVSMNTGAVMLQEAPKLEPPSSEPYKLKSGMSRASYSQFKQDLILLPILKQLGAGFFVESGALDGEMCSNSLLFEMRFGWNGLLVEPDPRYFPNIHSQVHRHSYAFNGCLSPSGQAESLQFDIEDKAGWSKISNNGVKENKDFKKAVSVQAQPLHTLLETIGQHVVDFWSLDIEGSEGKVLKGTDFSKVEVGVLLIEMNKNDDNDKEIREVMNKEGFQNIGNTAVDQIFINPKYFQKRGLPVPTGEDLDTHPGARKTETEAGSLNHLKVFGIGIFMVFALAATIINSHKS